MGAFYSQGGIMIRSIMVSSNEPEWVQKLNFRAPVSVTHLDTGDLWVSTEDNALIVVERKETADLLNSIKDGRLFNQAERIRQITPYGYFVITQSVHPLPSGKTTIYKANQGWQKTGWSFSAVQGALLTVQELGCHVVTCAGDGDFLPCILRLAHRSRENVPVFPVREATVFGGGENVLASLPGIGARRATEIMKHFPNAGSALWFLTDLDDKENRIPGIGNGIKRKIVECLGGTLIYQPEDDSDNK